MVLTPVSWEHIIFNMDREEMVFFAGVTLCAIGVAFYIFWGPTPNQRRRGALIGLQNLGLTCFLNSVLQAMASCATYVQWLHSCSDQGEVAAALFYLLKVLSTEQIKLPEGVGDPLAPVVLRDALHRHGWIISPSEQDAHELYHLLMVTLEEEAHKSAVAEGGITDALEPKMNKANGDVREGLPSGTGEQNIATTPSDSEEKGVDVNRGPSGDSLEAGPSASLRSGDVMYRKLLPKYDCNRNYQVSPFCGMLTSQLQCVKCNFKSVVRFDKFDSLSLHLPDSPRLQHTLSSLLERFTGTEAVTGVECEGCNLNRGSDSPPVTSTSYKTLSIGKLPKCLCIHIHRMSMGSNGTIYKRSDFVDFPEFLAMDPYTHNALMKEQKSKEQSINLDANKNESEEQEAPKVEECQPKGETRQVEENASTSHEILPCRTRSQNLYRLQAVVVHRGSAQGGHFITYRRGPLRSSARLRWYYTSDDIVEESSLTEALNAVAYMLFYEKYTNT